MESYRASLNHEMRAPLETSKQTLDDFLKLILSDHNLPMELKREAKRVLSISNSQLMFVASFIDDLLSMSQSLNSQLVMENKPFQTRKLFDFILKMFQPMMKRSETKLFFHVMSAEELRGEVHDQNCEILLLDFQQKFK